MAAPNNMNIQQQNDLARAIILNSAVEMTQQIYSNTFDPRNGNNVINIVPRNVGLIKGFLLECYATVNNTNGASTAITTTNFNIANLLSQIVFNDLNNNVRINTTGWHLDLVATAKQRGVFGAAYTTDSPVKYGSNWNVIKAASSVAAGGSTTVYMMYWIPLAYSDTDLRGAVFANVVNATMNLQVTVNANPVVSSGDATLAIYSGTTGNISSITINCYQVYLDQLPVGNKGVILPLLDLSYIYELKNTTMAGMVTSQDFPIPYPNFRTFLSTSVIYDNGGTLAAGTDINYISLQSANFTNIWKIDPQVAAFRSRMIFGDDPPTGVYYFDHRTMPINTIQYGNMNLIINPNGTVNAGASFLIGFEDLALINAVSQAGSLPGS